MEKSSGERRRVVSPVPNNSSNPTKKQRLVPRPIVVIEKPDEWIISPMNECDKTTREYAKTVSDQLYSMQKDENLVICPDSPWFEQLYKDPKKYLTSSSRAMIYAVKPQLKIGSTLNSNVRAPYYGSSIFPINKPDSYTPSLLVDTKSREMIFNYWNDVKTDLSIPPPMRNYITTVDDRGMCDYGVGRNMFVEMIEFGGQRDFKSRGQRVEFTTFSQKVWDARHRSVQEPVDAVREYVESSGYTNMIGRPLRATCSWKTGNDDNRLSSTIVSIEAAIGNAWEDPLPFAADDDDPFSTNYTDEEKDGGRNVVVDAILNCKHNGEIHFLDRNEYPLYPKWGIKKELERHGYVPIIYIFGDEIIMYVSTFPVLSFIFVHKSLGIAGESRNCINMQEIILRSLCVEFVIRITHYFRGEDQPDQYRPFLNALQGSYNFEMTFHHLHNGRYLAAAAYRDAMTPASVNAFYKSELPKAKYPMREYPITQCIREVVNGKGKDETVERPVDTPIVWRSKAILSTAKTQAMLVEAAIRVYDMMGQGGYSSSERWPLLMKAIVPESDLYRRLKTIHDETLLEGNYGNRTQRLGTDTAKIISNGNEFVELIDSVMPSPNADKSRFFFIREKQMTEDDNAPLDRDRLPRKYRHDPICQGLAFEGVKSKFRDISSLKDNTSRQQGQRVNMNLRIRPARGDDKYKIDGFIRCYLKNQPTNNQDDDDDTSNHNQQRGPVAAAAVRSNVRTGQARMSFDAEHQHFLSLPRGSYVWLRDLSDDKMSSLGRPIEQLTTDDLSPYSCENEPIYHELVRENLKTKYKKNRTINFSTYRKGKNDTVPVRVKGYVRCCFNDPK